MNIFLNDNVDRAIKDIDIATLKHNDECDNIIREVYDNEYTVIALLVIGDKSHELLNINSSIDCLASNLNINMLPEDVKIVTCLNSEIITHDGYMMHSDIELNDKNITPIYIGIDASYLADKSNIALTLSSENDIRTINIELVKNGHMLHNKGADNIHGMARLQWLNSTLFKNNKKSYIYNDIDIKDGVLKLYGKDVILTREGYIDNVLSYYDDNNNLTDSVQTELLDGGIKFVVSDNVVYDDYTVERVGANINIHSIGRGDNVTVYNNCAIKYEGAIYYDIEVVANKDCVVDIEEINAFSSSVSKYMNGLGHNGGLFSTFNYKWNGNYENSLFVGDVNAGACIKWLAEDYSTPLNKREYSYKPLSIPNTTWSNNGNGGIDVLIVKERARVSAYAGKVSMACGEKRVFRFSIHLTPFHEIDMSKRFASLYYENNKGYELSDKKIVSITEKRGLNNVVLHNNNNIYPLINAPLMSSAKLSEVTSINKHLNMSVYYNLRDISIHSTDVIPMLELGAIYRNKQAEISKNNYDVFRARIGDKSLVGTKNDNDITTIVEPSSRYDNYYVEAVNYLAKECNIKGVTLEDPLMDRTTVERVRKVLDRYNGVIGNIISNTNSNKTGYASSMNNNIELLPFMDSIVTGKGFNARNMTPEEILVELSGIPYGMCADGIDVDPFLGMLYGVVQRNGVGGATNKKIHKLLLDKFDIIHSKMVGFWSKDAIKAKDDGIKVTYYVSGKKVLICMYNFNNYPAVSPIDYGVLDIDGVMKSYPMSRLIMNQKFYTNTTVVLYNKCGLFMLADLD